MRTYILPILAIPAVIGIDQFSKFWVEQSLPLHERVEFLPFLHLYRTYNTGVAFSMFDNLPGWALVCVTGAILLLLLFLWWRLERGRILASAGFALIVGGAIGNLIDRSLLGYVIDFLLFQTESWSFAIFNLADSFISIGAFLVIVDEILHYRKTAGTRTAHD